PLPPLGVDPIFPRRLLLHGDRGGLQIAPGGSAAHHPRFCPRERSLPAECLHVFFEHLVHRFGRRGRFLGFCAARAWSRRRTGTGRRSWTSRRPCATARPWAIRRRWTTRHALAEPSSPWALALGRGTLCGGGFTRRHLHREN